MIFEDERAAATDRLGFVLHLGDFIGAVTDDRDPAGLSHWRAARFEALRAGRPAADVEFCAAAREARR
jgi:hypothetical protein